MQRPLTSKNWRVLSRALVIRTAIALGVMVLLMTGWWQMQVGRAIAAADVGQVSVDQCEDLDETNDLVVDGDPSARNVDEAPLNKRLDACAKQGFEPESDDVQ